MLKENHNEINVRKRNTKDGEFSLREISGKVNVVCHNLSALRQRQLFFVLLSF